MGFSLQSELSKPRDLGCFRSWIFLGVGGFSIIKVGSCPISPGSRPVGGCLPMLNNKLETRNRFTEANA